MRTALPVTVAVILQRASRFFSCPAVGRETGGVGRLREKDLTRIHEIPALSASGAAPRFATRSHTR